MTLKRNDKILFVDVDHVYELLRRTNRDGHNDCRVIGFCIRCMENRTYERVRRV